MSSKPLRLKLSAIVVTTVAAAMLSFGALITNHLERISTDDEVERLQAANVLLRDMIGAHQDGLRLAVQRLGTAFRSRYGGTFTRDEGQSMSIAGVAAPTLRLDGRVINLNESAVDDFSRGSGGVAATVLVRVGDDFLRISTSLIAADGKRVLGSYLGREHPALPYLLAGSSFQGEARLAGRPYMTDYEPIKDAGGKVIGALFVGMDLTQHLDALRDKIRQFRIGRSGYAFILDTAPGANYAHFVLHPAKQGMDALSGSDANGKQVIREILAKHNGVLFYAWANPELGEEAPRKKVAAFAEYPQLSWIIGASGYVDDFMGIPRQSQRDMLVATGIVSLLLIVVLNLAIRRLVITPMLDLQKELAHAERSVRTLFDNMHDAAFLHRADGTLVDVNEQMLTMYGVDRSEALTLSIAADYSAPANPLDAMPRIWRRVLDGKTLSFQWVARRPKDGSTFDAEVYLCRCMIGGEEMVLTNVRNITEQLSYEQKLAYQAAHDELTGLPNRSLLSDRLEQMTAAARRHRRGMAVAFIDLDRFKYVNDTLGHSAGDQLLQMIAQRIEACLREDDTAVRLGGDEFVVLLPDLHSEQAAYQALRRIQEALARPCLIGGRELFVTCSIGISLFPRDAENAETLLRHADMAMYRAKDNGRDSIEFFTEEMNRQIGDRLLLEAELRRAFEHGDLELHYQPQVAADGCTVVGAEALIRWHHPEQGMISPARFIPVAEETGLIVPIGEWVLHTACQQARVWQDEGRGALKIAVNVSAKQFLQHDRLIAQIRRALRETGLSPALLELEITESMLMSNPDAMAGRLREIKAIGVQLALDDFGTGYSSLSYLSKFPIDVVKVDQSFVRNIASDRDNAAIVVAIIGMAHALRLKVVAEGVESSEQLDFLRQRSCDELQGYFFGRPVAPEAFRAGLKREAALEA